MAIGISKKIVLKKQRNIKIKGTIYLLTPNVPFE